MSPARYELVLFDLDGTLVYTAPDIADAVNAVLRDHDLPAVAQSAVQNWIGHGTRELLVQAWAAASGADVAALRHDGTAEHLLPDFARHYAACCGTRGSPCENVVSTLTRLRAAGVKLVLLTNKEQRYAEWVLRAHGLDGFFDLAIYGDTLPAKKPHPVTVLEAVRALDVRPEFALLVGDSAIDVQTARNAGISVWAVPYGYNRGEPVESLNPDRVIPTVATVLEAIPVPSR